jgi:DNA-damage-inducible protein J
MTTTTNLNIRTDKEVKEAAEQIFNELGLSMTTAVNIFLRQTIRSNGIPFELKLNTPNDVTMAAVEEGRKIARNHEIRGCTSIKELRAALEDDIETEV